MHKLKLSLIIVLLLMACGAYAQKQGIKGKVIWIEGDQMPGPGKTLGKGKGVSREVYVYKATTMQQAKQSAGFFSDLQTELVAKIVSKDDGSFCVNLPVGEYSVFTKEPEGLFANLFDDQARINVVKVDKKKFTEMTFKINYQAAY
jgi:hypothetical protein